MAAGFQSWGLFFMFAAVMITRGVSVLLDPSHAREEAMRRSAMSIVLYLLAVFVTLFAPLPELGVTTAIVNEVYPSRGSGVWERRPEVALAAGVLYFSMLGIGELWNGLRSRAVSPTIS